MLAPALLSASAAAGVLGSPLSTLPSELRVEQVTFHPLAPLCFVSDVLPPALLSALSRCTCPGFVLDAILLSPIKEIGFAPHPGCTRSPYSRPP
jgi:hypothetical protein